MSWEYEGDSDKVEKNEGMGDLQREILAYIEEHGATGPSELARELERSLGCIGNTLKRMRTGGWLQSSGGKWTAKRSAD